MLLAAAVLAAALFFLLATLPPQPLSLPLEGVDQKLRQRTVRGAYHIHTTRSDGAADKRTVAAAAARAGLQFAIFTEHGDGTRPPDAPAYIDGVLCIDGVEISTNGGHYVALGLSVAPYPLGGEAAAVVDDVRRLGGFGIAAHPDHPKPELSWGDPQAPIDGLEWINADAEWRDERPASIARVLFYYLVRPAPALASVLDRPQRTLDRWTALASRHPVVALAAADAHGGMRGREEDGGSSFIRAPSYEASFRTFSNRVVLDRPLSGDAATDAAALLDAIERGSAYTVVDAISPDVAVDLDPDRLQVLSTVPSGGEVVTFEEGRSRRLEVRWAGAPGNPPVPWVLTNWRGGAPVSLPHAPANPPSTRAVLHTGSWRVEKDPLSQGDVRDSDGLLTLRYALAEGPRGNQFVAAAADLGENAGFGAIVFRGRASRPMRVSVQLRFRPNGERWVKSVYLDQEERAIGVPVKDMVHAERTASAAPPSESAQSLLFVVDLVNATAGTAGEFTIRELRISDR